MLEEALSGSFKLGCDVGTGREMQGKHKIKICSSAGLGRGKNAILLNHCAVNCGDENLGDLLWQQTAESNW